MIYNSEIACYSDRSLALKAVDEIMAEAGFEAVPSADPNARRFRNPNPWFSVDASATHLAKDVSFRIQNLSLSLEADFGNVKTRTMLLCWAIGLGCLALIFGSMAWSVAENSFFTAMAPIAPWPFLVPVLHRSMNRMAIKRWEQTLRLIGRTASAREVEVARQNKAMATRGPVGGDQTISA